ncbi:unnamed protein product [Paramecium sonneborni]|uniref:Uncharacterized protein n=1 Tax=Paramecium sonneborni TaxID=65129 RepID=A0A8S1MDS1_9CILI|nr:unnamed protein product [Paramecium sonneborni]
MNPIKNIQHKIIVVIKTLVQSLSFPLDVKVSNTLLNKARIVAPETMTPTEKLPFNGQIDSQLYSIKTGTIGIRKNPKRNCQIHNRNSNFVINIGNVNTVKASDIKNSTIPIALYFLNFNTILDTKAADKNPPMINIEEAIEQSVSTNPQGDIKYGTFKPNPFIVPKQRLNLNY